jgi:hypothetical protein
MQLGTKPTAIAVIVLLLLLLSRWTNQHVLRMDPGSQLSHRAMRTALQLPLNDPNFEQDVLDKVCKPNGYIPVRER